MIESLTTYVSSTEGRKKVQLPGTEDWVEVVELGSNGGYEWCEFKVFYSPSARRYFWFGDHGCSCNDWSDALVTSEDFQNGDRDNLLLAWKNFTDENSFDFGPNDHMDGVAKIRKFEEPK